MNSGLKLAAGVSLLRTAALIVPAVLVGLILATFAAGASQTDEAAGLERIQVAVLFFGPLAAIATLAFIVILALTRPRSISLARRRRTARWCSVAYTALGIVLIGLLTSLWWAVIGGIATSASAAAAWYFIRDTVTPGEGLPKR